MKLIVRIVSCGPELFHGQPCGGARLWVYDGRDQRSWPLLCSRSGVFSSKLHGGCLCARFRVQELFDQQFETLQSPVALPVLVTTRRPTVRSRIEPTRFAFLGWSETHQKQEAQDTMSL